MADLVSAKEKARALRDLALVKKTVKNLGRTIGSDARNAYVRVRCFDKKGAELEACIERFKKKSR